jgi:hypothetical protein
LRYPGVSVSIIAILSLASGIFLGGRLGNIIFKPLGIEGVGEKFGSMIGIGIGFVIMNGVLPELGKVFLQP